MEVVRSASRFGTRTAVVAAQRSFSFGELLDHSSALAERIAAAASNASSGGTAAAAAPQKRKRQGVSGERVAFMAPPGAEYVTATWATWLCGRVAVPIALSHPPAEIEYVLRDAKASFVLATSEWSAMLEPMAAAVGAVFIPLEDVPSAASPGVAGEAGGAYLQDVAREAQDDGALIIYTSGTTGRPKGALHTHGSLAAQVTSLCSAWGWRQTDRILHPLPLHHIHGIVNALLCAHYVGSTVEFMPKFSPNKMWERVCAAQEPPITVFMGVPTMYVRLLQVYDKLEPAKQDEAAKAAGALRLTISGSAACPVPIMNAWEKVSGQRLLERYGMTEIGMALSNPLEGERRPGFVGTPLPGVEVRVLGPPTKEHEEGPGELLVKGPNLFREYFGKPEATAESFDEQGYFRTGDVVVKENGYWRIMGRSSVDIIKSGGYKISALDIEGHLLEHPDIAEAAVVGIPDEAYGEIVGAVLAAKPGKVVPSLSDLGGWAKSLLAPYKIPKRIHVVDAIPRNAMGKVNKKELVKVFDAA